MQAGGGCRTRTGCVISMPDRGLRSGVAQSEGSARQAACAPTPHHARCPQRQIYHPAEVATPLPSTQHLGAAAPSPAMRRTLEACTTTLGAHRGRSTTPRGRRVTPLPSTDQNRGAAAPSRAGEGTLSRCTTTLGAHRAGSTTPPRTSNIDQQDPPPRWTSKHRSASGSGCPVVTNTNPHLNAQRTRRHWTVAQLPGRGRTPPAAVHSPAAAQSASPTRSVESASMSESIVLHLC